MLLQLGDKGKNIMYLQYALHIACCNVGEFDGDFGNETKNAVEKFQRLREFESTGVVDDKTWSALSDFIKVVQTNLNRNEINIGLVDGLAGEKTYNGVILFQKNNNLLADGMVGKLTGKILFSIKSGDNAEGENMKKIFIDPGHGGSDPGAVSYVVERDVVLEISKKLGEILENKGNIVKFSRATNEQSISLVDRAMLANNWGADIFISIHANSAVVLASGTETYAHTNSGNISKELSKNITDSIASDLDLNNRGMKLANFAVLRETKMPAVLIETAFVNNQLDANKLSNKSEQFANAIAKGILNTIYK